MSMKEVGTVAGGLSHLQGLTLTTCASKLYSVSVHESVETEGVGQ